MKLSDYFEKADIATNGEFLTLGHAGSQAKGTLVYCDTIFYLEIAKRNENVSCIITTNDLASKVGGAKGLVCSPNPRNAFYRFHNWLVENNGYRLEIEYGIGSNCHIHPSAQVSKRTSIGNHVTVAENAVIKDGVAIGDHTFIDAGAVIGGDGILYITEGGNNIFVKHAGGVQIGRSVSVLSNAVIARSIHNSRLTTIGENTIVGITSNIGHEAQIGRNCVISGNCVIARMTEISEGAWIGTSSFIREYVKIGRFAKVMAGSVVVKDVEEKQEVSGNFAIDHKTNLMQYLKRQRS